MDYQTSRHSRSRRRRSFSFDTRKFLTVSTLLKYLFFAFIIGIILLVVLFLWYSRDLPTPGKLVASRYKDATRIYDRNHVLLYSVYQNENRTYVGLSVIPKQLQEATISTEDKNFYTNNGFSFTGMLRAVKNMALGGGIQSGSTITQQLVKNVLLTNQQTLARKIKEIILSIQVDQKYSKDQILEMYLNNIPYGGTAIGVEAASELYFNKNIQSLDLAQSAFLSGLPQSPSLYSPFSGTKYYLNRTQEVLHAMVANGYIEQNDADKAYKEIKEYHFSQNNTHIKAPYFVMYVRGLLADQFGEQMVTSGGLQVTTSLDYTMQQKAEDIVKSEIDNLKTYHVGNGAAIITDPKTGEILSFVGGKDYFGDSTPNGCNPGKDCTFEPNVDAALSARQPGSSLKPVIYATAFEHGYTPATMLMDVQTNFKTTNSDPDYIPVNYDGKFHGPIQLRFALGNSLNIPAVKTLARVGIKPVMQQGYDMGINSWQPTPEHLASVGLSLVLGGRETTLLDETTAYGVFANQGIRQDPVAILNVTDSKGNVLYQHQNTQGPRVLPANVSFIISHVLSDDNARSMEFGPNSWLVVSGHTVSVKTGTTDQKRDNWTIGYTPKYVVGVWVGNDDNSVMNQAISSGITGASPIWNKIMTAILKGKADQLEQKPDDVNALQVDALAGGLPHAGQPTRSEYFIKGTEPTTESPIYQNKDGKNYLVLREDDPVSTDGTNRWQQGIDAWIQQNHSGDEMYHPPTEVVRKATGDHSVDTQGTPTPTPNH
ncbi:MAG TPA: transglycosylase domain-containing protein [Candidatus Sulfotelmatobacter sp.]|jgi:membrane peptidoglycan carboxypeptidase|nr:transglycosylase domain-containing protein [Candidatus Sulfotelmatobacter sp.]